MTPQERTFDVRMTHLYEELYENGFEVIAKTGTGRLCCYVPPGESLKESINRLQSDDPIWRKPRIRVMCQDRIQLYRGVLRYMNLPAMIAESTPQA